LGNRLSDNVLLGNTFQVTNLSGAGMESDWLGMGEADSAEFVLRFLDVTNVPTFTITVKAAENVAGLNSETIKEETGFQPSNGNIAIVDLHTEDLPDGKPFVKVLATETAGGINSCDVQGSHLQNNLRKKYGNLQAATLRIATWE